MCKYRCGTQKFRYPANHMYCPQCGTESTAGLQYCRSCGANLKVIGKAVTLSEAIARSDRGPLPKIKEMMKNFKLDHVTEEISTALDQMNTEIVRSSHELKPHKRRKEKTPEQRRENHIIHGTVSLFSGVGIMIFLYYLTAALVLKLPPDVVEQVPFEIDPVVRVLWLIGLIPALSGLGRIIAGLTIRTSKSTHQVEPMQNFEPQKLPVADENEFYRPPASVSEHTTNMLHQAARRSGQE